MDFELYTRDFGRQLWRTDGTSDGLVMIASLASPGDTGEQISDIISVGGRDFFVVTQQGGTSDGGETLWVTDGTKAGTANLRVSNPTSIIPLSGGVWVANSAGDWVSDGTLGGTSSLSSPSTNQVGAIGGELFYEGYNGIGEGLFESIGTISGTHTISFDSGMIFIDQIDGGLLFESFTGDAVNHAALAYSRRGTTVGLASASMVQPTDISFLYAIGQTLYYVEPVGFPGSYQEQMAAETENGTVQCLVPAGFTPNIGIAETGGVIYFTTATGLYTSSGSVVFSADQPHLLGAAGHSILFAEQVGVTPELEMYSVQSKQISALAIGAATFPLVSLSGEGYFIFSPVSGSPNQLWMSDGTASGTQQFDDLANVTNLSLDGTLLTFDVNGQLWTSDGTIGGTGALSAPVAPTILTVAASNDFSGDGRSDFLIENAAGAVTVGQVAAGAAAYTSAGGLGSDWTFHGAGDLLADGKVGFLIEDAAGAVDVGEVAGGSGATYTQVTALGPEWTFHGVADFLGAGDDQFLIENAAGAVVVGQAVGRSAAFTQVAALGRFC